MSVRNNDPKGHWRCRTVSCRVAPEESAKIDMYVKTSGMLKQDFLVKRALGEDIIVRPNIRIQKNIIDCLDSLTAELKRINAINKDSDILANLQYLLHLIDKLSPE